MFDDHEVMLTDPRTNRGEWCVLGEDTRLAVSLISNSFSDIIKLFCGSFSLNSSHRTSGISVSLPSTISTTDGEKKQKEKVLLQHHYKLELSACLYDKYLARYKFLKNFEGFLSRPPSRPTAEVDRNFPPPYLKQ